MRAHSLKVCIGIGLAFLLLSAPAWSKNPMMPKTGQKKAASEKAENIALPRRACQPC